MIEQNIDQMMYLCFVSLIVIVVIPILIQAAPAVDVRSKRESSASNVALASAVTELERQSQLTDAQFVSDFANANTGLLSGDGGHLALATAGNFPTVIGHRISMALGYLGLCGLDTPIYHPRADEFNLVVTGAFRIGFFQENGARFVTNTLVTGQAMIIPQVAMHFIQNLNCTQSIYAAAFNSADLGSQKVADAFFNHMPADIVLASVHVNASTLASMQAMVANFPAVGVQECRQRCGLK